MSISSAFSACIFGVKTFCAAFLYLQFGFVIFRQKNIGAKAARKMLMILTTDGPRYSQSRDLQFWLAFEDQKAKENFK